MSIFSLRRRDALSDLRLPPEEFVEVVGTEDEYASMPEPELEPEPANELATAIIERGIAEAVRLDNPPPIEVEVPAPLSQRHLETIDRMVAHLKADEKRLEKQISDARRQLADTQLARHAYERNSADLRRGIASLIRLANAKPTAQRTPRAARPSPIPADGAMTAEPVANGEATITVLKPRPRRKMH